MRQKDSYIEELQAQMRRNANDSAEKSIKLKNTINELRLELGDFQEKEQDLKESLSTLEKSNEAL